ncbi:MAG TPA: GNAT family N-acetyltransferase [Kofleriaceae bacterium]
MASLIPFSDLRHGADWLRWRELAGTPFLSPEFFALIHPLGTGDALVAQARSPRGLVGALPLSLDGDILSGLAGEHSPGYDYIGAPDGLETIWATLRDDARWNELVLGKVPVASPLATLLPSLARRDHCPVVVTADTRHLVLPLRGVTAAMNPKFRSNLQRCMRKAGDVVLERLALPTPADLDEACAIEARAWKGAAGTAIASDPAVDHVYRALARVYGRRGQHALYFLRIAGVRVATLFALEDACTVYALKIGHDPAYASLSPGHLIVWQVAEAAEQRGLEELDFVGREDGWKRKWTERVREHVRIVIYRRSLRGLSRYALRELVRPHLPEPMRTTPRSPLPRRCQHDDRIGTHSRFELVRERISRGLGIRRVRSSTLGRASRFPVGSWVRVHDYAAIDSTLDKSYKLRGLEFVDVQRKTAGQVFQVERHVRRLRDDQGRYRAVNATVLLAGVDCGGHHAEPTGCGKHCPLMYRDEWLVAAVAPHIAPAKAREVRRARVRDLAEIYAGLDAFGRRDGITFIPEMAAYAGQRFVVASELSRVFECDRWTTTAHPVWILEGLQCTGAVLGTKGPCDRACSLLWHRDWLMLDPRQAEV